MGVWLRRSGKKSISIVGFVCENLGMFSQTMGHLFFNVDDPQHHICTIFHHISGNVYPLRNVL